VSTNPKRDDDGLHDGDKQQGDLRNAPHADRELPEGLKRERKGPVDKDTGRKDQASN